MAIGSGHSERGGSDPSRVPNPAIVSKKKGVLIDQIYKMFYSCNQEFEAQSQPWNFFIHENFSKTRELFISYIIDKELRRAAGRLSSQSLDPLPNPLGTTTKAQEEPSVYSLHRELLRIFQW